ncbi:hypothetical protein BDN72DRAFT_758174 [Pluteus cervinus]|uniref:Uncharacterized protein n=1 Tax=Pluteus cervinus TaxID=181527 RepID=A0ACD3BB35_9AGAR|nr:hypothetical protein BDN72DRAFT_758174 [Pluteus cervinus]
MYNDVRPTFSNPPDVPNVHFPEPQLYRSISSASTLQPPHALRPQRSYNDMSFQETLPGASLHDPSLNSVNSFGSSYPDTGETYDDVSQVCRFFCEDTAPTPTSEHPDLYLDTESSIKRFQSGELSEEQQDWYRLVPPEAIEALGDREVQRQSVIFEVFKAEREYVADLEAISDVYIAYLRNANPPIIKHDRLDDFIAEVFGNVEQILANHKKMLSRLFSRQTDQHPLIQSVADIVLDAVLSGHFCAQYEVYIQHYPIAENRHRKELKRNRAYKEFLNVVSSDPRIRKRDIKTFLSRPVTRLPRLNLLLEQILKKTEKDFDHPDLEALPTILDIVKACVKSTQPGIEAAESKVKFWELCESLVFPKDQIIDMDLDDESRTLVQSSPVVRRVRKDTGFTEWVHLDLALLDNYLLVLNEKKIPHGHGAVQRPLLIPPIPLGFLVLGSFDGPSEIRKERTEEMGVFDRSQQVPLYPLTIFHAVAKSTRRYTVYVTSESLRQKWHQVLTETIGLYKARQDANMWFLPKTLTEQTFKVGQDGNSNPIFGRITAAVPFTSGGRDYIAASGHGGVFVSSRGEEKYQKVLSFISPISLAALQSYENRTFNRFLVHHETSLTCYSLDMVVRVALGHASHDLLQSAGEKVAGDGGNVVFFKPVSVADRVLVIYSVKRTLHNPTLTVVEPVDQGTIASASGRIKNSFRPFGETGYVPKNAYDVVALNKNVGICTNDGIVVADPKNLAKSEILVVPNFEGAKNDPAVTALKSRLSSIKPLGLVQVDDNETLIIYETIGFYTLKRGEITRSARYIRWEVHATAYAHRGEHILLFSSDFIEARDITNGRLVQVIDGRDIRLLFTVPQVKKTDPILVAMRSEKDSNFDSIVELVETTPINSVMSPTEPTTPTSVWAEWDM